MLYTTEGAVFQLVERGYSWSVAARMVAALTDSGIPLTIANVEAAR